MRAGLTGVLRADVLADLLRVYPRSFGVDVYLEVLGDRVDEVAEVGPHLYHYQVLPALLARTAVHLRNQVELLEGQHGGQVELADLVGVEDGVVEVQDYHRLLLGQHLLDETLLVLLQGTAGDQQVASLGLLLKQVTRKLAEVLLLHLLETKLAAGLQYFLVLANHLPNPHDHCAFLYFLPLLLEV